MTLSQERVDEFKKILEEKGGKEVGDEEAREAAENFVGFVELLWDLAMKDAKRKRRLKKEPNGFPVDGNYTCLVCGRSIDETTGWYDWFGQTCLICHKAIKEGVVPVFICREGDSYYHMWEMKNDFGIHSATARKMVREGSLKARMIMDGKHVHEYIFLKKENPTFIDPDRHNAIRKSYDRNRDKVTKEKIRETKKETRAEILKPKTR